MTTRFWLNLPPTKAVELVHDYLATQLPEEGIRAKQNTIRVHKAAGGKSVTGSLNFTESDTHAPSGQTLVSMRREKVRTTMAIRGEEGSEGMEEGVLTAGLDPALAFLLVEHRAQSSA